MKSFIGVLAIVSLLAGLGSIAGCSASQGHVLLGKHAPDFTISLAGGGEFRMGGHLGKDVVLLDFWASWCPPCREALPLVSSVASEYAGQGLVFCAVNVGEDASEVIEYLKKAGLDIPAGLDTDGKVANAYGAKGIPQTVLIGKDGVVESVHVGYDPRMATKLKEELGVLLAGEHLLTPEAS